MVKPISCLKTLISCLLILLQVSDSWCEGDLSPSLVKIYSNFEYLCTGTLVNDKYVVTSAGCLKGQHSANDLIVEANNKGRVGFPTDVARGADIFIHKGFNRKTGAMDLAVIELTKPIAGPGIHSAKLCDLKSIKLGEAVKASALKINGNPHVLSGNLATTDSGTCSNYYQRPLTNSMSCVVGDKKEPCFEETGFPVAVRGQFCGVLSAIPKCTDKAKPYIFTSLANQDALAFIYQTFYGKKHQEFLNNNPVPAHFLIPS